MLPAGLCREVRRDGLWLSRRHAAANAPLPSAWPPCSPACSRGRGGEARRRNGFGGLSSKRGVETGQSGQDAARPGAGNESRRRRWGRAWRQVPGGKRDASICVLKQGTDRFRALQAELPMQWDEQLAGFRNDIKAQRWDRVGRFLQEILERVSYEAIEAVEYESDNIVLSMISVMAKTELRTASLKGRYLFSVLVRKAWTRVDDETRWRLLCYASAFYGISITQTYSSDVCLEYVYDLADKIGLLRDEVISVIVFKAAGSML